MLHYQENKKPRNSLGYNLGIKGETHYTYGNQLFKLYAGEITEEWASTPTKQGQNLGLLCTLPAPVGMSSGLKPSMLFIQGTGATGIA